MKKIFLVFPLAIMLANCSSTRSTANSSSSSGGNNSSQSTAGSSAKTAVTTSDSTTASSSGVSTTPSTTSAGSDSTGTNSTGSSSTGSSTTGTNSTGSTDTGSTMANPSTKSTVVPGTMANSGSTAGGMSGSTSKKSAVAGSMQQEPTINNATRNNNNSTSGNNSQTSPSDDVFDPNNFMQNPERYLRPDQLTKTGGWTYNKDWRRNTNFASEAVGQWQLVLTPEVTSSWRADTSKPESYASFWTPEAVMNRQQLAMAAAAKTMDSVASVNNAMATAQTGKAGRSGGKKSSLMRNKMSGTGRSTASSGMSGKMSNATAGSNTMSANNKAVTGSSSTGSGTTGAMGTGGIATDSTNTNASTDSAGMANNSASARNPLMAVNGNNYMLPMVNLFIGNGSFTAYTGCNNALGTLIVNGNSLHFQDAFPSTNIECTGGFDQAAFIDRLHRADSYDMVNSQIRLKQGEQVLMVFSKNGQ